MIGNIPIDFGWLHDDAVLSPSSGPRAILIIALLGAGAAVLAAIVVGRIRGDRARYGPAVRHLARGLGVSRLDQRLLDRVARVAGHPHAGSVMISRGCFDTAVRVYAQRHGRSRRLDAIRDSIFE